MADTIEITEGGADAHAPIIPAASTPLPPPPPQRSATLPPPRPAPVETETLPPSGINSGPSAIFAADAPVIPTDHGAPVLPASTPAVPSAAPPAKKTSVFDVDDLVGPNATAKKKTTKSPGRWFRRLVLVGLLGAGGWYGSQHGPALYEEYFDDAESSAATEPVAPLAFPNVTPSPLPVRTAEFVLTGLPETPGASYRVTTDFETNVSQVDITRDSAPDLQVLTYGSDAMIRRADGEQWYLLDRGQFPLDGRLERADWVRQIDELLPPEVRDQAVIVAATESTVSGVAVRHLVLTVDPGLFDGASPEPAPAPGDAEAAPAADPTVPVDPAVGDDPAAAAAAAADAEAPISDAPVPQLKQIELWIDGDGLIRQMTGAPQLGANTITVLATSADAWIPDYPSAGAIAPLTASALVDLGI